MIPSQVIRLLRRAAAAVGLELDDPPDSATHDDLLDVLAEMSDRVDAARPGPPPGERHDEIAVLAGRGLTDPQIAAELRLTVVAVRSYRRRHRIPAGDPNARARSGWQDRLRELHSRGLTVDEIVAETGWTRRTVHQHLSDLRLRAHRLPRSP